MRDRIIKSLAYARYQVQQHLELDDCPHSAQYDQQDQRCQKCEFGPECQWLCSNDEFAALERKSTETLVDALVFSLGYIDALITRWGHDSDECRCEACAWLREAVQVFAECQDEGGSPSSAAAS